MMTHRVPSSGYDTNSLVESVDFSLLGDNLGSDVALAVRTALRDGAVFADGSDPLVIFRGALASSIRDIESHPRGKLFQDFLRQGPYEGEGDIPEELVDERLSDSETAAAITFIFSFMVNSFKGAIAELLATGACTRLLAELKQKGILPQSACLYVGDSVAVYRKKGKGVLKGADLHILIRESAPDSTSVVKVAGVVEVKSYVETQKRLRRQLDRHHQRAKQGLRVNGVDYSAERIKIDHKPNQPVVRISVLPSQWTLSRNFWYEESEHGRYLQVERREPPTEVDSFEKIGKNDWLVTLRWSVEALAEAAYEMTFWYMEKVGEIIYSTSLPKGWDEMTPGEAGRNAVKMMLYYANHRFRCGPGKVRKKAIALYHSYGFGYALGMNFFNAKGKREMLWSEDLDEILA